MDLVWIEDFFALVRTQAFTEAAAQRCSTQPAFSRRIRQLEAWLGAPLFDRTARPVRLTAEGEAFRPRAERMREDMLDARRFAMVAQSHYAQTVRVYTTTAIATGILPRWLAGQKSLNHSILTSSTSGCLEALRQKRADRIFLPLFTQARPDPSFAYEEIADDPLVLTQAKKGGSLLVFKQNKLSGALLMHTPGSIFGQNIARHLAAHGIMYESPVTCESSSTESLLGLVKQGMGAAWIPLSLHDSSLTRCAVPAKLDIPCRIFSLTRC